MIAALYSERKELIPEVKTISAGELPGMRAAKPAAAGEEEVGAGVRAKALSVFLGGCFGRANECRGRRRFGHALLFLSFLSIASSSSSFSFYAFLLDPHFSKQHSRHGAGPLEVLLGAGPRLPQGPGGASGHRRHRGRDNRVGVVVFERGGAARSNKGEEALLLLLLEVGRDEIHDGWIGLASRGAEKEREIKERGNAGNAEVSS